MLKQLSNLIVGLVFGISLLVTVYNLRMGINTNREMLNTTIKTQKILLDSVHVLQQCFIILDGNQVSLVSSTKEILKNHATEFGKMQNVLNSMQINPKYRFEK